MKKIIVGLFAATVLGAVGIVQGAGTTATVAWVAPTSYTDGSAIVAGDIASYTLKWVGVSPSTMVGEKTVTTLTTTVPVACGSVNFTVVANASGTAKYPGTSSEASSPPALYGSGITCTMNPPTGVTAS